MSRIKIVFLLIMFMFCVGCSPIHFIRGFIGIRIDHLDTYNIRYSKVYDIELSKAYNKLLRHLKDDKNIFVYSKQKDKAIYARCFNEVFPPAIDTTDAGFYFSVEGDNKTKIEVTSLNSELARFLNMDFVEQVLVTEDEKK